jgi:hypothetical protein
MTRVHTVQRPAPVVPPTAEASLVCRPVPSENRIRSRKENRIMIEMHTPHITTQRGLISELTRTLQIVGQSRAAASSSLMLCSADFTIAMRGYSFRKGQVKTSRRIAGWCSHVCGKQPSSVVSVLSAVATDGAAQRRSPTQLPRGPHQKRARGFQAKAAMRR